MTEGEIKAGQTKNQQEAESHFIFKISKVKHGNSPKQAGTGGTHQPELTIFLAFYLIMGEQHMEKESGQKMKDDKGKKGAAQQKEDKITRGK